MDLTEAEDNKRWQKHTEELSKKDLHDPDDHDGVISPLEPDILECEVKWALRSITKNKASGGHRIPNELFQILKDDAVKANLEIWKFSNMPANLENSALATGLEKVSFHSNLKERQCQRMLQLLHNCTHLTMWEDTSSIPGSGRSSGEGNGNPLQYSCLENPMDRGVWWATVHGVAKSQTRLSNSTLL